MSIIYDFKAINEAANKISSHMLWPYDERKTREQDITELVDRVKRRIAAELSLTRGKPHLVFHRVRETKAWGEFDTILDRHKWKEERQCLAKTPE